MISFVVGSIYLQLQFHVRSKSSHYQFCSIVNMANSAGPFLFSIKIMDNINKMVQICYEKEKEFERMTLFDPNSTLMDILRNLS